VAVNKQISEPMAHADVRWVSPEAGGRRSGPPTADVYAATAIFVMGDDAEVQPGWPSGAQHLSILLQRANELTGESGRYKVDFLARGLAWPLIHPGAELLIMEGPKIAGNAKITDVVGGNGLYRLRGSAITESFAAEDETDFRG
jgi:hypothetical protein